MEKRWLFKIFLFFTFIAVHNILRNNEDLRSFLLGDDATAFIIFDLTLFILAIAISILMYKEGNKMLGSEHESYKKYFNIFFYIVAAAIVVSFLIPFVSWFFF